MQPKSHAQDAKAALRARLRQARAALTPAHRCAAARAITEHLCQWSALQNLPPASCVALYLATPDEPNLDDFIRHLQQRGVRTLVPGPGGFHLLRDDPAGCLPGSTTWRQPPAGAPQHPVAEAEIVLVPGLGFTLTGRRLGQGGGWYDSMLQPAKLCLGVGFTCQIVDDLPQERHDHLMDWVVTEAGLTKTMTQPHD